MTDEPNAFPWRRVMGFGLGVLGWPPETFWRATVAEMKAAADGRRAALGGDILDEADVSALRALLQATADYPSCPPPAFAGAGFERASGAVEDRRY